jgi:hypothetical protein
VHLAADYVQTTKKLPPPTPDRCEGRLFPPELEDFIRIADPFGRIRASGYRNRDFCLIKSTPLLLAI